MAKIILPVCLNPISRRKDKSVKMGFETRELTPEETLTLMAMEGEEGWILFSSNQDIKEEEIPDANADLGQKTQSTRIRSCLYKLYMQETQAQTFLGTFENYYKTKTEVYIEFLKAKIND